MPLTGTEVIAHLSGGTASVTVKQSFQNPNVKPLEAIYVFPLPSEASVHGLSIAVGGKRIRGDIKRRGEAARIYQRGKKSAKTAALLDQERPNIFTQAIANILPKSTVEVELKFDVPLRYEDGFYHFVFPMVVGPRYIPGDPNGRPTRGWGESADTDRVPDASKITPPTAPAGTRSGRNVKIGVTLKPGAKIQALDSPTHMISATELPERGRHAMRVELKNKNEIPNKDFVLRYKLADERPTMRAASHNDHRGGFFSLRLEPPPAPKTSIVAAKDLIVVVDTSGGMASSLPSARRAIEHALNNLNAGDRFQIVRSADAATALSNSPLENTASNRKRAASFLSTLRAGGGSELSSALTLALAGDRGDRLRVVSLVTTGLVGNEAEVVASAKENLDANTRIFPLGVGPAPNRYLLRKIAEVGRGTPLYLLPDEPESEQIERLYQLIRSPVLTHIEIDWKGLPVRDLKPMALPDLFVGRPIELIGRFSKGGRATIEVRGKMAGRRVVYEVPVVLAASPNTESALPRLWARAAVRSLESAGPSAKEQIAELGLQFQIVTSETSFVAVANKARIAPGDLQTIVVPVDPPAGSVATKQEPTVAETPLKPLDQTNIAETDADKNRERLARKKRAQEQAERDRRNDAKEKEARDYGDDDDDDDSEGSPDAGDGDGDYAEDPADDEAPPPPTSPRVAERTLGADAGGDFDQPVSLSGSLEGTFGRRARLSLGIGLGATTGALGEDSAFAAQTTLHLDRAISRSFGLGAGLGLRVRGPANDRVVGSFLATASYLTLLQTSFVRLEAQVGAGPSVSESGLGLGLMGALKLHVPIPVGLQLRYDAAVRFGDDESTGTVTGGFEFSF